MALANQIILRGTRAAQPAAASLTAGALYCVSNEGNIIERTTGAAWEAFSPGAGSGDVTASGTLTASALMLGAGTTIISAAASLGTATTLLHGNAAGAPTFGAVVEADITFADNTTNNAATTKHGLLKKLSNVATEYMDGTGAWSTPAGGSGGAVALITETVTSGLAASVTFSAIAATWRDLIVRVRGRHSTAATGVDIFVRFNGDTGTNYHEEFIAAYSSTVTGTEAVSQAKIRIGQIPGSTATASYAHMCEATIGDYRGTTFFKSVLASWGNSSGTGGFSQGAGVASGQWISTAAITSVTVLGAAGNFVDGTVVSLYGSL